MRQMRLLFLVALLLTLCLATVSFSPDVAIPGSCHSDEECDATSFCDVNGICTVKSPGALPPSPVMVAGSVVFVSVVVAVVCCCGILIGGIVCVRPPRDINRWNAQQDTEMFIVCCAAVWCCGLTGLGLGLALGLTSVTTDPTGFGTGRNCSVVSDLSCEPYYCDMRNGRCFESCSAAAECSLWYTCSSDQKCVQDPAYAPTSTPKSPSVALPVWQIVLISLGCAVFCFFLCCIPLSCKCKAPEERMGVIGCSACAFVVVGMVIGLSLGIVSTTPTMAVQIPATNATSCNGPRKCAPYFCDAKLSLCGTSCKTAADCVSGYTCNAKSQCVPATSGLSDSVSLPTALSVACAVAIFCGILMQCLLLEKVDALGGAVCAMCCCVFVGLVVGLPMALVSREVVPRTPGAGTNCTAVRATACEPYYCDLHTHQCFQTCQSDKECSTSSQCVDNKCVAVSSTGEITQPSVAGWVATMITLGSSIFCLFCVMGVTLRYGLGVGRVRNWRAVRAIYRYGAIGSAVVCCGSMIVCLGLVTGLATTSHRPAVPGNGTTCVGVEAARCTPYYCDTSVAQCFTTCEADDECTNGYVCLQGKCIEAPREPPVPDGTYILLAVIGSITGFLISVAVLARVAGCSWQGQGVWFGMRVDRVPWVVCGAFLFALFVAAFIAVPLSSINNAIVPSFPGDGVHCDNPSSVKCLPYYCDMQLEKCFSRCTRDIECPSGECSAGACIDNVHGGLIGGSVVTGLVFVGLIAAVATMPAVRRRTMAAAERLQKEHLDKRRKEMEEIYSHMLVDPPRIDLEPAVRDGYDYSMVPAPPKEPPFMIRAPDDVPALPADEESSAATAKRSKKQSSKKSLKGKKKPAAGAKKGSKKAVKPASNDDPSGDDAVSDASASLDSTKSTKKANSKKASKKSAKASAKAKKSAAKSKAAPKSKAKVKGKAKAKAGSKKHDSAKSFKGASTSNDASATSTKSFKSGKGAKSKTKPAKKATKGKEAASVSGSDQHDFTYAGDTSSSREEIHLIAAPKARTLKKCVVCMESKATVRLVGSSCRHGFCGPCAVRALENIIEEDQFPARCPGCVADAPHVPMTMRAGDRSFIGADVLERLVKRTVVKAQLALRFLNLQILKTFAPSEVARCPVCSLLALKIQPTEKQGGAPPGTVPSQCSHCSAQFCAECGVLWLDHAGFTCEEYEEAQKKGNDPNTDRLIAVTTKQCPHCAAPFTHYYNHGCHHIMPGTGCPSCGHHFCSVCLRPEPCLDEGHGLSCDHRCGCQLCPDCRPGRPCRLCEGCPRCAPIGSGGPELSDAVMAVPTANGDLVAPRQPGAGPVERPGGIYNPLALVRGRRYFMNINDNNNNNGAAAARNPPPARNGGRGARGFAAVVRGRQDEPPRAFNDGIDLNQHVALPPRGDDFWSPVAVLSSNNTNSSLPPAAERSASKSTSSSSSSS